MRIEPIRTRLADEAPSDPDRAAAAALLRLGDPAAHLHPAVVARIGARLGSGGGGRRGLSRRLRLVFAAAALLAVPAAMAAIGRFVPAIFRWAEAPVEKKTALRPAAVPTTVEPQKAPLPVTPLALEPSRPLPPMKPKGPRRAERAVVAVEPEASPPAAVDPVEAESSGPSEEARLVGAALDQARRQGNPAQALSTLDEYQRRFPTGLLENEAALARVDAYLALGRKEEALAALEVLNAKAFAGVPRSEEMRLVRAELLAALGRCQEAVEVFEAVLVDSRQTPLAERALFGKGSCRAALGDPAGSRATFERYLQQFPAGRFADRVRKALEGLL